MAILLGPSGVGLIGLYTSITDLTQSIVGMGINSSGVRQIAEAAGSDDSTRIAITAQVLRRTSVFLGILGTVFLFGFAPQISLFTFGNIQHVNDIRLISLAIFFSLVSAGQGALIQGMRRISDLAKMGIFGALSSAFISILAVYFLGQEGIALSLVLIAAMTLSVSWWFSRKIITQKQTMGIHEIELEQSALLKLGFAFMIGNLLMSVTSYLVRMIIVREIDFYSAGLYQSAWTLGGMYIGIILQAMGTDFYPRLTAVASNNSKCNRLVNEQTHIGFLLASPGIMATLIFAPLVIDIFYTEKFQGAVELLRWLCLGMSLRVISWPMGFIIMAKGAQNFLIISEFTWAFIYVILIWICVNFFKLNGVGIAFFGSYVFHLLINYLIAKRLSGFFLTKDNIKTICLALSMLAVVFCSYYSFTKMWYIGIGILAILLISFYVLQEVLNLINLDKLPLLAQRALRLFRFIKTTNSQKTSSIQPEIGSTNNWPPLTDQSLTKTRRIMIAFIVTIFVIMVLQFFLLTPRDFVVP